MPAPRLPSSNKYQVLFVLGGPGAGKGTQCQNVVKKLRGWSHISAGDCLREERAKPDSKWGATITERIEKGMIVPVEITVNLLLQAMEKAGKRKVLIDGYPRNMDNVTGWAEHVGDKADVRGVLHFDVPEEEMEKRIKERSKTEGRTDDDPEVLKKRFETNKKDCEPIIEMYKEQKQVRTIDGTGDADKVWQKVMRIVKSIEREMPPPLRKPNFVKVEEISLEHNRINTVAKVVRHETVEGKSLVEVVMGDDSGIVTMTLKESEATVAPVGKTMLLQNVRVGIFNDKIRLETDKWAVFKENDDDLDEVNEEKDISAETHKRGERKKNSGKDGKGKGKGKGKKGGKGKGKGKGKRSDDGERRSSGGQKKQVWKKKEVPEAEAE